MRTSLRIATAVASLLCLLLGSRLGMAQTQPRPAAPSAAGPSVVVIDVGHIFRNHTRFKQKMENLKKDLEEAERVFQAQTQAISDKARTIEMYKPGTPDFNRIEEEITRDRARLQADMALKKKEFMLKEAGIYNEIYEEIVKEVAYFCERHGVDLVLRFNSESIDPQDAQSVMKGVNRNVVYQQNVNITYEILKRINPPEVGGTTDPRNLIGR